MAIKNIAVVVPSHKQELTDKFLENWEWLFNRHNVEFILIDDSEEIPFVVFGEDKEKWYADNYDLISNHCAGVRQLGFLYIAQNLPDIEYIITLDTDTSPIGDPIQDHIDQLNSKVSSLSWMNTIINAFPRGYPYGERKGVPVKFSHGVWEGVPDLDAPTQLLWDNRKIDFAIGKVPKGIFIPTCGMNIAFKRELLPYVFFAPVGQYKGAERFDDIWMGIELKKDMDKLNWAMVTGYARVNHLRASNVFISLEKEAVGIRKNEEYWQGEYDEWYKDFIINREKWFELTK
jgi:hypothetical protein